MGRTDLEGSAFAETTAFLFYFKDMPDSRQREHSPIRSTRFCFCAFSRCWRAPRPSPTSPGSARKNSICCAVSALTRTARPLTIISATSSPRSTHRRSSAASSTGFRRCDRRDPWRLSEHVRRDVGPGSPWDVHVLQLTGKIPRRIDSDGSQEGQVTEGLTAVRVTSGVAAIALAAVDGNATAATFGVSGSDWPPSSAR